MEVVKHMQFSEVNRKQIEEGIQKNNPYYHVLSKRKVTIIGIGGIGSHVAVALCRAGVGSLEIIDFDMVDAGNLGRQYYTGNHVGVRKTLALKAQLEAINPACCITCREGAIRPETAISVLSDAEFIVEAVDNADTKAWLTMEILQLPHMRTLVGCSGMAGWGDTNDIVCKQMRQNWFLCGDFVSDIAVEGKITAARVMVCAGHMAHRMLLELIKDS